MWRPAGCLCWFSRCRLYGVPSDSFLPFGFFCLLLSVKNLRPLGEGAQGKRQSVEGVQASGSFLTPRRASKRVRECLCTRIRACGTPSRVPQKREQQVLHLSGEGTTVPWSRPTPRVLTGRRRKPKSARRTLVLSEPPTLHLPSPHSGSLSFLCSPSSFLSALPPTFYLHSPPLVPLLSSS